MHGELRHQQPAGRRMGHLGQERARQVLLVGQKLGRREDRPERYALGLRRPADLVAGLVGKPRRQDVVERGDVLPPAGARRESRILEARVGDQAAQRRPLRHGVDDGDVAVAAGHGLELGIAALAAGRRAGGGGAGRCLPVHPLQDFGQRDADARSRLASVPRGERRGEPGEGREARRVGRLVSAELQRLARRLADHVHQSAQRLEDELAHRPRRRVHLGREGRDLDRRCAGPARQRGDRGRLLEQDGVGTVEQGPQAGAAGIAVEIEHHRALRRVEEMEEGTFAGRKQRRHAAHGVAVRRLDLEHAGAEVGRDLAGERCRQPQAGRHLRGIHLDDGEAGEGQ